MSIRFRFLLAVIGSLFVSSLLNAAELQLSALFSDHMVIQRDKAAVLWGWADAGEEVIVEFAGQRKSVNAGAEGQWRLRLDPLLASAEGRKLVVTGKLGRKLEVDDVLVGDVWLGSGQSNMAFTVSAAKDFEKERAASSLPLIRHFKEESSGASSAQTRAKGSWNVCSEETVGRFSAVLYFFGREIHREVGVPIGLINTSVGGTPIEQWIDPAKQETDPALKRGLDVQRESVALVDPEKAKADYEAALEKYKEAKAKARAGGAKPPRAPQDPIALSERKGSYGSLFNGKVAPLIPYTLKGVLWYQGEANSADARASIYGQQLSGLIRDWRVRWEEELPFAWVQLPNFTRAGEGWPLIRESMLKTLALPNTGMAITIDIGEPKNIHPTNKQEVGRRLSLWALGTVYGRKVPDMSGPLPVGNAVNGAEMTVTFSHADGLTTRDGGAATGFQLAASDKQWKPAVAKIEGQKVIVSSAEVAVPVALRYAWQDNPDCNLVNASGLPASPFRTDDWECVPVTRPVPKGKGK
jgi:sialate O-acetylesterase